jgi:hypothetical protein
MSIACATRHVDITDIARCCAVSGRDTLTLPKIASHVHHKLMGYSLQLQNLQIQREHGE